MRMTLISAAAAAALVCAPLATAALAASAPRTAAPPAKTAATTGPTRTSLRWPVCDKTHTDHCIELGWYKRLDRETNRAYPQCAKINGRTAKASCIETAFTAQERHRI